MPQIEAVITNDYDFEEVDQALHSYFLNSSSFGISQSDDVEVICSRNYGSIVVLYDLDAILGQYREGAYEDS